MLVLGGVASLLFAAGLVSSVCTNSPTSRQCWDGDYGTFNVSTDYYMNTPNTGRIVEVFVVN
jgi:hypothetical protein